jgi:hypothetical protein
MVANLLDISNEMAEILTYQIRSQTDDPEAARATVAAFTPLATSIRRTIMLHEKLGQPVKPRPNRIAARKRIIRDVEDAIETNAAADEQETLHAELLERLDRPDLDNDIADRPIADIVTDITRDLGVAGPCNAHPAKRRIPHDIAVLNARAEQSSGAAPSEMLAALLASAPPRPPRPATQRLYRDPALNVATMSDEEIERRLKHIERLRHPPLARSPP